MLITFKSPASGDVTMLGDVAGKMMAIIGREFAAQGIITPEHLPAAIASLKAAISADRQTGTEPVPDTEDEDPVRVAQRALPLVELFEWSLKRGVPVVWGV